MKVRRLLSPIAAFALTATLALAGCGGKKEPEVQNGKWDPKQVPKGAYPDAGDMDAMKAKMKPGGQ